MDRQNVGEYQSRLKNTNQADKMINDRRGEFYSTKKLDSLYVQGKQILSSALFMGPLVNI